MTKLGRELERELIEGLAPRRRRALIERLRGNVDARRGWDRAIAAVRVIEDRSVSRFEIDQVERWLFEDLADDGVVVDAVARPTWRWTWLGTAVATLATAAALALWIGGDDPREDELRPRGAHGFARPLALDLVCGTPPRPATQRGCELDELLGFSVRLGAEDLSPVAAATLAAAPLRLSMFGIGDDGEVRYYLPTPAEAALPSVALESRWQALPLSIRLAVNHAPGRVRVFALASDEAPTVADIDRLAAALRGQPRADVDTLPWHLRLDRAVLGHLCRDLERCSSAEAEFSIPDSPVRNP